MDPTFLELSLAILETVTLLITLRSSDVVTSLADIGLVFLKHQDVSDELLACLRVIDWSLDQEAKTIPEANQKNVIGSESS